MAVKFPFITAFVCERILQERDQVNSAIRIVDVFYVRREDAHGKSEARVQFFAFLSLKTSPPPPDEFTFEIAAIAPSGETEVLASATKFKFKGFEQDPSVPSGATFVINCNVKPKGFGTYFWTF